MSCKLIELDKKTSICLTDEEILSLPKTKGGYQLFKNLVVDNESYETLKRYPTINYQAIKYEDHYQIKTLWQVVKEWIDNHLLVYQKWLMETPDMPYPCMCVSASELFGAYLIRKFPLLRARRVLGGFKGEVGHAYLEIIDDMNEIIILDFTVEQFTNIKKQIYFGRNDGSYLEDDFERGHYDLDDKFWDQFYVNNFEKYLQKLLIEYCPDVLL